MKKQYKRRIIYIDGTLQGWLITTLILLESVMVITALIYLRFRYSILLDEYLYSIHLGSTHGLLLKLLHELVVIVVLMLATNFIALLIANGLWGRHINHIIACFRTVLKRIQSLDLSRDTEINQPKHEVLDQLESWRNSEAERCQKLIGSFSRLHAYGPYSKDKQLMEVHNALALLPNSPNQ